MTEDVVLELRGVSRQFGAVRALTDVSFDCRAGEVHALVGENGSGKSTLLGVASGFVDPDLGSVQIGGQTAPYRFTGAGPYAGSGHGLSGHVPDPGAAGQEQPLPGGAGPTSGRPTGSASGGRAGCSTSSTSTSNCSPMRRPGMLTLAERQLFEVAKALVAEPKVLLLDEPTTALGPNEVEALHRTVAACRQRGVGVVYVSHRLPEVLEIADRITVLRDGRNQGTFDARRRRRSPRWSS